MHEEPKSEQNLSLRQRAEIKAESQRMNHTEPPPEAVPRILHELRVHQIELEMQNEELCRAQVELETTRERYVDLYDFAPVAYFTISEKGMILEPNLTMASLLGVARGELIKQPITRFILQEDQNTYYLHCQQLFATAQPQACELRMVKKDGTKFWAHLTATVVQCAKANAEYRIVLTDITAHKRSVEQIRTLLVSVQQEKDRLSALINSIADEVWFTDSQQRFTLANPSARQEFQLAANSQIEIAELVRTLEVLRPDGSPRPLEESPPLRALAGVVVKSQDEIVRTPMSGEMRHRQVSSAPVRDGTGQIIGAVSVVRDITARKQMEEALRKSEIHFQAFFEQAGVGVAVIETPTGRFAQVNQKYCDIVGYSSAEMRKSTFQMLTHPEDLAVDLANMKRLKEGKILQFSMEKRYFHKNGQTVWVNLTVSPLWLDGEPAAHHLAVVEDITERKRAEEAQRQSQSLLQSVTESTTDAIFVKDTQGRYLMVNAVAARLVGKPIAEIIGKDDTAFLPMGEARQVMAGDRHVIASCLTQTYEELLNPGGEAHTFLSTKGPVRDNQGRIIGLFGIARDITDRKQTEKKIQLFSHEIIAAREEERKQVSSALHHDVGSLAVGISAHLDALEAELRSGKSKAALKLLKGMQRQFVKSVARLKGVAVQLRPPDLDILGLRVALRQYFVQLTKHRGTQIHFTETLGRRRVSGAPATILFRVAQEAVTNAIKHGRAKHIEVSLKAKRAEIILTIHDNGKGFDPAKPRARATSRMGLRVMQEMAASAGGTFTIASGPGKGTTVVVRL